MAFVVVWPYPTVLNPTIQIGNLARGQLSIRWHLQLTLVAHGLHQQTLRSIAKHESWPLVSTNERRLLTRQTQPGFLFFLPVACMTFGYE